MSKIIKAILQNNSILFTLMSIIASAINFLSIVFWGRIFSVDDYGKVSTIQAFVANFAVFITPLQIMICRILADDKTSKSHAISQILSTLILIIFLESVLFIIGFPFIKEYFHFSNAIEMSLLFLLLIVNNIYIFACGVIQGQQHFLLLGSISIIVYSIKLLLGYILGIMGLGVSSVIIALLLAETFCTFVMLQKGIRKQNVKFYFSSVFSILKEYIWTLVLYMIISFYINNGDLLLANLYCAETEMGLYSVASSLSKISIFLIATPIATVIFPKIVAYKDNPSLQRRCLVRAEGITIVIAFLYGLLFYVTKDWIISFLYGESYAYSTNYVGVCTFLSVFLCVFYVFYQYALATKIMRIFTIISVFYVSLFIGTIICNRCSIKTIPVLMASTIILTIMTMMGYIICKKKNTEKAGNLKEGD